MNTGTTQPSLSALEQRARRVARRHGTYMNKFRRLVTADGYLAQYWCDGLLFETVDDVFHYLEPERNE
jgi:hypothetical protein